MLLFYIVKLLVGPYLRLNTPSPTILPYETIETSAVVGPHIPGKPKLPNKRLQIYYCVLHWNDFENLRTKFGSFTVRKWRQIKLTQTASFS